MGYGHRPSLLGIVHKVALGKVGRIFTDDLDRVFARSYGTVRAETVEHGTVLPFLLEPKLWVERKAEP